MSDPIKSSLKEGLFPDSYDPGSIASAMEQTSPSLKPASPVGERVIIDASRNTAGLRIRDLRRHLGLLVMLAVRDLAVRYRQAIVGVGWAVVRPLTTVTIFVLLFGSMDEKLSVGPASYAVTALVGILTWQMFASMTSDMTESLIRTRHVLTKVYFPRILIPLASSTVAMLDYLVGLIPALIVLLVMGVRPTGTWIFAPFWMAGIMSAALAAGMALSALNARYRDVGHLVPFLLQIGFFVSPVIYETRARIPENWLPIYSLNPLAPLLDGLRHSLLGSPFPPVEMAVLAIVVVTGGFWGAWNLFHSLDRELADRI